MKSALQPFFNTSIRLSLGVAAMILLPACTLGPDFQGPPDPLSTVSLKARHPEATPLTLQTLPATVSALFNDATLASLERAAVKGNLDLQEASARIDESRALAGLADAQSMPTLGVEGNYARSAISQNSPLAHLDAPTYGYDLWQAGFQASWEIDLWGATRRQRESAQARLLASHYSRDVVQTAIVAEVARNYVLLRGMQTRLSILDQTRALLATRLKLAESRERNGISSRQDAIDAQADLTRIDAARVELQRQLDAQMNALARLAGLPPLELNATLAAPAVIPRLSGSMPTGIPSEIAHRRPDILQAEASLHAATASIGAAHADFYPRVSLTGNLGTMAFHGADLGLWDSRQYSFGPTVYLPIFDGGRLKQTLALTEARGRSAGLAYRQTVLRAWHEIDDALNALTAETERHASLASVVQQSEQSLKIARNNYAAGATDFGPVLAAEQALLNSQSALSDSTMTSSLSAIALYKALGGGWSDEAPITRPAGAAL